jgi:hypothetical protein
MGLPTKQPGELGSVRMLIQELHAAIRPDNRRASLVGKQSRRIVGGKNRRAGSPENVLEIASETINDGGGLFFGIRLA